MKTLLSSMAIGIGALLCQGIHAQDPAAHTALCKDGTYFDGTTRKGACKGHQGIKQWLNKPAAKNSATPATTTGASNAGKKHHHKKGAEATPATTPAATATAPAASTPAATTTSATAAKTAQEDTRDKNTPPAPAKDIVAKPGGGPGLVWVNTDANVYHCQDDEWYGKTQQGSYMSMAAAEKAGAHPAHDKACP
jgi:hypothetical protein